MIGGDGDLLDRMRLGINGPSCLSPRGIRARLRGVVRINGNVNITCMDLLILLQTMTATTTIEV